MEQKKQDRLNPDPRKEFEDIYPKELSTPRNNETNRICERKRKKKTDNKK